VVVFAVLVLPLNIWGILTWIPIFVMILAEIYTKNKED
jgi:hypothetical protein